MADSPIIERLRQISRDLAEAGQNYSDHGDTYVVHHDSAAEMRQEIDAIVAELERADAEPNAGTSAYQMVADAAQAQVGVTETLIHMVAATVLAQIDKTSGPPMFASVAFSPFDMDEMHRRYEMTAKHDGMITTVSIKPRADDMVTQMPPREANLEAKPESLMTQDEPEAPAKAQAAPHVYDRPLWAVRRNGKLVPCSDQEEAERKVRVAKPDVVISVENRFCYHQDCPASGCLRKGDAEVASSD